MNRDFAWRKLITVSQFFAKEMKLSLLLMPFTTAVLLWVFCPALLKAQDKPFLPGSVRVVSTVPANQFQCQYESPGKWYNDRRCAINPDPLQPSELVEFTVEGQFVKQISLHPSPGGSFGLAVETVNRNTAKLAAVDDSVNLFLIWTSTTPE